MEALIRLKSNVDNMSLELLHGIKYPLDDTLVGLKLARLIQLQRVQNMITIEMMAESDGAQ